MSKKQPKGNPPKVTITAAQQEQTERIDAQLIELKNLYVRYFQSLRTIVRNPNSPGDVLIAVTEQVSMAAQVLSALGEDMQEKGDETLAGADLAQRLMRAIGDGRVVVGRG